MAALVRIGACQGCGACLLTCPEHAIRPVRGTLIVVGERCTGCGECIEVCPADAIAETWPAPDPARTTFRAGAGAERGGGTSRAGRTARWRG